MFSIRKETMVLSDLRAKTMTESISGIRLIKFYGWENMVFKNLEKIRVLESHFILLSSIIRGIHLKKLILMLFLELSHLVRI